MFIDFLHLFYMCNIQKHFKVHKIFFNFLYICLHSFTNSRKIENCSGLGDEKLRYY